jgi:hypothetical protein
MHGRVVPLDARQISLVAKCALFAALVIVIPTDSSQRGAEDPQLLFPTFAKTANKEPKS